MDPVTTSQVTFVISRLADGALGEAGKQAWEALAGLVRRLRNRESHPLTDLAALADGRADHLDVGELASMLVRQARSDPDFSALLRRWLASADWLVREGDHANVNVISGTVHGPAVQARDVMGSINFGSGTT